MTCGKCEHLKCFGQDGNECSIAKCPLVVRNEALEEAAKVVDENYERLEGLKQQPEYKDDWDDITTEQTGWFGAAKAIRDLKTK